MSGYWCLIVFGVFLKSTLCCTQISEKQCRCRMGVHIICAGPKKLCKTVANSIKNFDLDGDGRWNNDGHLHLPQRGLSCAVSGVYHARRCPSGNSLPGWPASRCCRKRKRRAGLHEDGNWRRGTGIGGFEQKVVVLFGEDRPFRQFIDIRTRPPKSALCLVRTRTAKKVSLLTANPFLS